MADQLSTAAANMNQIQNEIEFQTMLQKVGMSASSKEQDDQLLQTSQPKTY